jgi:transposase-like protein
VDMNLVTLIEQFSAGDREESNRKCREYLEAIRWPEGIECPRCESLSVSHLRDRKKWECNKCEYQFSVTANTLFHDSHLPLWKWFLAVYLMCESKKGISANQMKRTLGVSYKTAWYLCHRIRDAMGNDETPLLDGVVEMDETFIGGKLKVGYRGQGKSLMNKSIVLGAVERGGEVRLKIITKADTDTIEAFIEAHVDDEVEAIYTDSWKAYIDAVGHIHHESVNHSREEWVRGDVHTNTIEGVWSLFKRSIIGSYHKLSVKHLPAYLDEMEFRYNNRSNPYLFRDTLLVLLSGEALTYRNLTAAR